MYVDVVHASSISGRPEYDALKLRTEYCCSIECEMLHKPMRVLERSCGFQVPCSGAPLLGAVPPVSESLLAFSLSLPSTQLLQVDCC
jgi:hypothetical protein